jgi:hypothetical protein
VRNDKIESLSARTLDERLFMEHSHLPMQNAIASCQSSASLSLNLASGSDGEQHIKAEAAAAANHLPSSRIFYALKGEQASDPPTVVPQAEAEAAEAIISLSRACLQSIG